MMITHDCIQLSPAWFELRRGIPTACNFDRILTPKTMKLAAAADDFICELIAERFHLGPIHDLGPSPSKAMLHGTNTEPEARRFYAMDSGLEVQQAGFCTTDDGRFGCSPDGLVGAEGLLELKCPLGKTHVGYLLAGELPSEYRAQCHGQLIVCGRQWLDFLSYVPGLPPFKVRVVPDDFTRALMVALEQFHERLEKAIQRIKEM